MFAPKTARARAHTQAPITSITSLSLLRGRVTPFQAVRDMGREAAIGRIAGETGLSRQTIYRIKDYPGSAEAALATWGI